MTEPLKTIIDRREAVIKILERDAQDAHDKLANAAPPVQVPDSIRVPLDSLHADAEYLLARLLAGTLTREQVVGVIRDRIDAARLEIDGLRTRVQELERERDGYKAVCDEWLDKTEWVQQTSHPRELGMHRADVLRERLLAAAHQAALAQAAVAGLGQETCQTCQGNGEVVTDWERYKHPLPGDVGDEAVAECQDCDGQGTVDAAPTIQAAPEPAVQHAGALEACRAACDRIIEQYEGVTAGIDWHALRRGIDRALDTQPKLTAPVAQGDARAEQALLKVLAAVQRYLPPDGPSAKDTLSEIIGIVDPWPLGDLKGKA